MFYKKFTAIVIALSFSLLSFNTASNTIWKEYKSIDGVTIYQKVAKCTNQYNPATNDYFVFKYVNNNTYDVRISYKIEYWLDNNCRSCNLQSPNEYEISIDIKAGQSLEYTCSDSNKGFKLYKASKSRNDEGKNRFDFVGLKVDKI